MGWSDEGREEERKRERWGGGNTLDLCVYECVFACVCVCGEWTRREWDEREREREEKEEEKEEGRKGGKERKRKGKGNKTNAPTNAHSLSHTHSKRELPKRVAKEGGGEGRIEHKRNEIRPSSNPIRRQNALFLFLLFILILARLCLPTCTSHRYACTFTHLSSGRLVGRLVG